MTNQEILKRLQTLEAAERDVASSMDMPQERTANWEYAETAAIARSAILQQQEALERIQQERLTWAMYCECTCTFCERLSSVIRGSVPQSSPQPAKE